MVQLAGQGGTRCRHAPLPLLMCPHLPSPPQMQIYFNTPAAWNKRMQLRLSGEPSLTLPLEGHKYGKVRAEGTRRHWLDVSWPLTLL